MDKKKNTIRNKLKLPLWISVIILCAFIALTFYVVAQFTREDDISFYLSQLPEYPMLVILNLLPIVWMIVLLYGITRRALFSGLLGFGIFSLMAEINQVKSTLREDPFIPKDITLIREALSISENLDFGNAGLIIAAVVVVIVILVLLFLISKPDKIKWFGSVIICVAVIGTAVWGFSTLYQDKELKESFGVLYLSKAAEYGRNGFVYSFVYDIATMNISEPDGYNQSLYTSLEETAAAPEDYDDAEKPHVIMIMGEAFSTISEKDAFDFTDYTDPLYNFKQIASDSLLSGDLMVDTFGGGTVSTEFMVLTGSSSTQFNGVSPYDFIRSDIDSLPRQLAKIGYESVAVHPGNGWFYNRDNVYAYMGFSYFYNLENSFDSETQDKGGYISEEATIDKVIDVFQNHLDTSNSPLFEFCVTIQNHGGYSEKYDLDEGANFHSDIEFSDEDTDVLTNYFQGASDADAELARLVEYLNSIDEPVILVYFGDHLPSLSTSIYESLGYSFSGNDLESSTDLYATPYFIWQNDEARQSGIMADNLADTELENGRQISAFHLGSSLMQLLGFEELSPFYTFLNDLRSFVPCKRWELYRDGAGTAMYGVPEGTSEILQKYYGWSYYKLFHQRIS